MSFPNEPSAAQLSKVEVSVMQCSILSKGYL